MKDLSQHLPDSRKTPQGQPIPGREAEMTENPAGGFTFKAGDWERLNRFLIIGTEGGTYYTNERDLTIENAAVVGRCFTEDPARTLERIIEVSLGALAPKNDPAILALAICFARPMGTKGEKLARDDPRLMRRAALQRVCRTGTHLFQFLQAVRGMRGGGKALNAAVRQWIYNKPTDDLALQFVKYGGRAGWTWRDVMRRFRPKPPKYDPPNEGYERNVLYSVMAGKADKHIENAPSIIVNAAEATDTDPEKLAELVRRTRLPWECVPSEATTREDVLEALFESMPVMATVRQLSKLQAHGVLPKRRDDAIARITNQENLRRARIHPCSLMIAAHAYEVGRGRHLEWTPDPKIVDALDDGFQAALQVAKPTGKRVLVAIDSSGSMHGATSHAGIPLFKIAAAMALTHVRTEEAHCIAFDMVGRRYFGRSIGGGYYHVESPKNKDGVAELPLSGRMRITDAMRAIGELGMGGGTDCSLPFKYALDRKLEVDAFVVFTDGETWAGKSHPAQALQEYRNRVNQKAKVVWCAMSSGSACCPSRASTLRRRSSSPTSWQTSSETTMADASKKTTTKRNRPRRPRSEAAVDAILRMPLGELNKTVEKLVESDRETAAFLHQKLGQALDPPANE